MKNKYFNSITLKSLYDSKLSSSLAKGIDKIDSNRYSSVLTKELEIICRKVDSGTYSFSPYLENLKLKGRGKAPRMISIPTLRDRLVLLALKEILHELFPECVRKKLPNSYVMDIGNELLDGKSNHYFLKLDIVKFYDRINRDRLLSFVSKRIHDEGILKLLKLAISTPTVPINTRKVDYPNYVNDKGVPQGLAISNVLAQIYLKDFDEVISKRNFFYRRYVDDIVVVNDTPFSSFRERNIELQLNNIGLELNKKKTKRGSFDEGLDFLGYRISRNSLEISAPNVDRFIRRVVSKVTWFKNGMSNKEKRPVWLHDDSRFKEVFLEELNEIITGVISNQKNYGWLFYFSAVTDKSVFFRLDKMIRKFFLRLESFNNKAPKELKKLSRAYMVIRFERKKNYLSNYDEINTLRRKRSFLIFRGVLAPDYECPEEKIEFLFNKYRDQKLKFLEENAES